MKQTADPNKLLFQIAESQRGLFTATQAQEAGFVPNNHAYHVKQGHWTKVDRGIYRYTLFPYDPEEQRVQYALWSRNREGKVQGVYSHESALSIYDLSDVMPAKLHMTVPTSFRKSAKTPKILKLYYGDIPASDTESKQGFRVTKPLRTIIDLISTEETSLEFVEQAFHEALKRGLITRSKLRSAEIPAEAAKNFQMWLKEAV